MLWQRNKFDLVYNKIKEASLQACCTVLILVAPDCDALAACRIFTALLRSDNVSYKIKPVSGYGDVEKVSKELLKDNDEIRSVLMLNCGGGINIIDVLALPDSCSCYIVDCHRPVHLANLYNTDNVYFFNDGTIDMLDLPSDGSDLEDNDDDDEEEDLDSDGFSSGESSDDGNEIDGDKVVLKVSDAESSSSSSSEEEVESDSEDNNDDKTKANINSNESEDSVGALETEKVEVGLESQRVEHSNQSSSSSGTNTNNDNNNNNNNSDKSVLGKRKRRSPQTEARHLRRIRRRKLDQYYAGTYFGQSSATLMYDLAQQLNKDHNNLLWLAIIGLTDHYIHGKLSHDHYCAHVHALQQEVLNKNADERGTIEADDGTIVSVKEDGKIVFQEEFRFMLYRHWSLYDSMYYSNFVASRLNIWKMDGKSKLNTFFAKIGISLDQTKQRYSFMSQANKRKLNEKIEDYAEEFGLSDFSYGSFTRVMGFKTPLSAADVVYIATALLEGSGKPGESWLVSFNRAYDALMTKKSDLLRLGLDLSMRLQKAVVRQGINIIEKRKITNAGPFRYTFMDAIAEGDLLMFSQPLALSSLARFVIESYRVSGKWVAKNAKPLVICSLIDRTNTYMVVGTNCTDRDGDIEINKFGAAFRDAASQIKARFKHDGFDTSVMEIDKDDVLRFIESLHEIMTI